jgi:hypothetical protein
MLILGCGVSSWIFSPFVVMVCDWAMFAPEKLKTPNIRIVM